MSTSALIVAERSAVATAIEDQTVALLELLPGPAAVARFKRVVIQAVTKNPDLASCTPASVIQSVLEAAAMGLEPTGSAGGAHLVPYNVNVARRGEPDRWEKRAQLIPDFRGVVAMVTRPAPDGTPSDVLSVESRLVKEGDDFAITYGSGETTVTHVPSLSATRSAKPTTHVYAVARLRSGGAITDVMDRAEVERIRNRGKGRKSSPWDTDWDEMARKTLARRICKWLPKSTELAMALSVSDSADANKQDLTIEDAIAGTFTPISDEPEKNDGGTLSMDFYIVYLRESKDLADLQSRWKQAIEAYASADAEMPVDVEAVHHEMREHLKAKEEK